MAGRTDINKYHNGCSKLINATVLPHGGITKRPGTEYIATAPNKCKLFPFEFSVDDALVLEFSNLLMRLYKDGAIVNDSAGTEDLDAVDGGKLVAHWLLNETLGTTVVNADDPGTYDGTSSTNAATLHADGKVGTGCFDLDGQYTVEIANAAAFSFDDSGSNPFSIVCWANITQKGALQVLFSKWRDQNAAREWRFSLTNEQKLQLHLADTSTDLSGDRVAQWYLNDDAANTHVDDVSTNHDGVATQNTNTAGFSVTGKINDCFDFGGDQAVVVPDDPALSFDDSGSNPFSLAAWIYNSGSDASQVIICKMAVSTPTNAAEWIFNILNQKLYFTIYDFSASAYHQKYTSALSIGWHFVVATYDSTGGTAAHTGMTLYVDGEEVTSSTASGGTYAAMENLNGEVTIGAQYYHIDGNLIQYWQDKIDNVIIFDIELTAANVLALYNDGNGTETMGAAEVSAIADTALTTGWHFLVATYDSTGGASAADGIILYVDGAAVDSTATNDADYTKMVAAGEAVRIGSQNNSADDADENFFEDKIDEVSIFSDVLTPTEVASLYDTTPYSIVSPYTSDEAFEIHVTQSADVMYIAHEDHHPKKLSRLDTLDWTLVDVPFTGGPFLDENTTAASLVGFARTAGTARSGYYFPTGAVGTLTASGTNNKPFNSSMVGALWLVKHTRTVNNTTSSFAKDDNTTPTATTYASHAIKTKGDFVLDLSKFAAGTDIIKLWRKEGNGEWQEFRTFTVAVAYSATEDEDDVYYAVTRQGAGATVLMEFTAKNQVNRGIVKITGFTSSTVVTVEVIDAVLSNNTDDTAVTTSLWAEGAWSDYRGYPRTVTFFEDRLWWASSTNNPDTLWSSKTSDYENMEFSDLGLDDDALVFPLNDNEVSQIQWMFARQVMAVGAANKEYRFGAANPDDPITPSDRKAIPQTSFSSGDIQPVILNDAIFFFQRQGKKLGAMRFDSISENFDVDDATLLAYRIFDSAPTCMAVQRIPDSIIWIVRADGVLLSFTFEPKEEVSGWARHLFGNSSDTDIQTGYVESVAVIHGSAEDEVWISIRRVINTVTVYYVEKMELRNWGSDIEDASFVDSGVTYDNDASSAMTGLTHLVAETVSVLADGVVFDDAVVSSTGTITLKLSGTTTTASVVQMGLPYTMKARTMRLAVPPSPQGTIQTRIKRIHSTVVRYIRSLLGSAGQEYGGTEYLQDIGGTYSTASQDTPEDARLSQGGFSEDAYTTVVSDDPVPFTLLSTVVSYEVEERR